MDIKMETRDKRGGYKTDAGQIENGAQIDPGNGYGGRAGYQFPTVISAERPIPYHGRLYELSSPYLRVKDHRVASAFRVTTRPLSNISPIGIHVPAHS